MFAWPQELKIRGNFKLEYFERKDFVFLQPERKSLLKKPEPLPLEAGDYYFNDQGLMVFTEQYHRKRGYCCKSGCKHCPYGFRKKDSAGKIN